MIFTYVHTSLERLYLDIFNDRPNITWLKDGVELNSFSEHEHVKYCTPKPTAKYKFHVPTKFQDRIKKPNRLFKDYSKIIPCIPA